MQHTLYNEGKTESTSRDKSYDFLQTAYAGRPRSYAPHREPNWSENSHDHIIGGNHEDINPSFLPATIIESLEPLSTEDQIQTEYLDHLNPDHLDIESLDTDSNSMDHLGNNNVNVDQLGRENMGKLDNNDIVVDHPADDNIMDNNMDHLKPDHVDLNNLDNGNHLEDGDKELSGQVGSK